MCKVNKLSTRLICPVCGNGTIRKNVNEVVNRTGFSGSDITAPYCTSCGSIFSISIDNTLKITIERTRGICGGI